jgi:formate dehydrogenase major subunit
LAAERGGAPRRHGWQQVDEKGRLLRRTMGIASLGGATLDNEENYLIKKLFTAAGAVQIENQARI